MITIVIKKLEYKGVKGFEELRDEIYADESIHTGCISATYSPKAKIGIFAFVEIKHVPDRMQKYCKHYHPST